jgi:hypothetical protein
MNVKAHDLVPMAHVADVQRSIDFYRLFAMEVQNTLKSPDGTIVWAHVASDRANLMFTRASGAVTAGPRGVIFYLYAPDVVALREHLLVSGVEVSAITYPPYMSKGEICLTDPDGYPLMVGQAG